HPRSEAHRSPSDGPIIGPPATGPPSMTTPAAETNPDGETVLTIVAATFVGCCLAVWTAGQIAARIWTGTWLPVPLWESPAILWHLAVDPAQPGEAWPPQAA